MKFAWGRLRKLKSTGRVFGRQVMTCIKSKNEEDCWLGEHHSTSQENHLPENTYRSHELHRKMHQSWFTLCPVNDTYYKKLRSVKNVMRYRNSKAFILMLFVMIQLVVLGPLFSKTQGAQNQAGEKRFDYLVRGDFFAGISGDRVAFDRAMKLCEDTLAKDPKHAEAMVWHGSGRFFLAGEAFKTGDLSKGIELRQRGAKEMNEAVILQPNNVAVLIPRGATLLEASRYNPDAEQAKNELQTAVTDYEKVLILQKAYFNSLSEHARGQLLLGLADGWSRLGNAARSKEVAQRIINELPGTRFAEQAKPFLK